MKKRLTVGDLNDLRKDVVEKLETKKVDDLIKSGDVLVPLSFDDLSDFALCFAEIGKEYQGDDAKIFKDTLILKVMKNKLHDLQG